MKTCLFATGLVAVLTLLTSCNDLPMETQDQGPAPYGPDPTTYLPPDRSQDPHAATNRY